MLGSVRQRDTVRVYMCVENATTGVGENEILQEERHREKGRETERERGGGAAL